MHAKTLEACYKDKVIDVDGQADILILAPTALGPYTKDCYCNPLLVNTYALGYYFNMCVHECERSQVSPQRMAHVSRSSFRPCF